jgi:integrase
VGVVRGSVRVVDLRPGEARGLEVTDIDWLTGTLHVERALRKDGGVKATKTKRGTWS